MWPDAGLCGRFGDPSHFHRTLDLDLVKGWRRPFLSSRISGARGVDCKKNPAAFGVSCDDADWSVRCLQFFQWHSRFEEQVRPEVTEPPREPRPRCLKCPMPSPMTVSAST